MADNYFRSTGINNWKNTTDNVWLNSYYVTTLLRRLGLTRLHRSTIHPTYTRKLGLTYFHESTLDATLTRKLGLVRFHESTLYSTSTLKLGFKCIHESTLCTTLLRKLGLKRLHESTLYTTLTRKLGLTHFHESTLYTTLTRKLGLKRDHLSIYYSTYSRKLGLKRSFILRVYKYIIDLKFYDTSNTLKKVLSSKSQNWPLISLEFELLRDGGCGSFKLKTSENINIQRGYRLDLYLYEEKWYSARVEKIPMTGTQTIYEYSGFGFFNELDWKIIDETYENTELSEIVEDIIIRATL